MPTYNSKWKLINNMWWEVNEIKIQQDIWEDIWVQINNNLLNPIQVRVSDWIRNTTKIINNKLEPIYFKNITNSNYLLELSWDIKITWRALIWLWLIGIIYWNHVTVFNLSWVTFDDPNNVIWTLILLWIIIELIIFISIFYRDISKYKIDKRNEEIQNEKNLLEYKERLKKWVFDERMLIEMQKIQNEKINRNIIQFWFRVCYPIFIWLLWIKYLYLNWNHSQVLEIFDIVDIFILCGVLILFFIFLKFKFKK